MISALEGVVEFQGERFVVLNTGGVSYRVYVHAETLRKVAEKYQKINPSTKLGASPSTGSGQVHATGSGQAALAPFRAKFWTHLYQREDTVELYGFLHYAELEFFELLIQIPGIGPKSGLGIMAVAPLDTLKSAIASGDTSYLTKVSGIGRKTAEKVILELREKMAGRGVSAIGVPELREESDALDALTTLGYTHSEARSALAAVPKSVSGASNRVQAALRQLGGGAKR